MEKKREELEGMTVEDLRKLCKEKGVARQEGGRKLRKAELIEKLMETVVSEPCETEDQKKSEEKLKTEEKKMPKQEKKVGKKKGWIFYAETLEEIEQRYLYRRAQWVYDMRLIPGCVVYFVHYITTKSGKYIKKLRTARVKSIDREKEKVYAEMMFGEEVVLGYDELIYIRQWDEKGVLPKDLHNFMRKQRTERSMEQIYEKFGQKQPGKDNIVSKEPV